jgi:hemoglobin-like flavoprotein
VESRQEILLRSIDLLTDRGDEFTDAFYAELFRRRPDIAALFIDADMANLRLMLLSTLTFTVESMEEPGALEKRLKHLGHVHWRAGVREEHFDPFIACLRDTLTRFAGEAWVPEMAAMWNGAFTALRRMMIAGFPNPRDDPERGGR